LKNLRAHFPNLDQDDILAPPLQEGSQLLPAAEAACLSSVDYSPTNPYGSLTEGRQAAEP